MSKAIPPAIRRKIIEFDPFDGHGLSITAFRRKQCHDLKREQCHDIKRAKGSDT
ncbi:hypothetical protein ACX3T8_05930 [Corynebacterium pyruviciproducens]